MELRYLTVSTVNKYIKSKIEGDINLNNIYVKGEISNLKDHTSGHLYFSIKDDKSKINIVMFKTSASNLKFIPKDGMKVLIRGKITVYEANGVYQVNADSMEEDGVGNLFVKFEELKQKLEKLGMFDVNHKKDIPKYPNKIGVITASTGAAIKDILTTLKRRYPIADIIVFPCLVQGINAKDDIVKNIILANDYNLDVIILGRGGGSIEDLWAFNEEIVAQAIYNSNTPIISAVGHEIDFTIADFVADLRAPTPTAAAELATPSIIELLNQLNNFHIRLNENIITKTNYLKMYLSSLKNSYVIKNPNYMYEKEYQKLDNIHSRLNENINTRISYLKMYLSSLKNSYVIKNPNYMYEKNKIKLDNYRQSLHINMLSIVQNRRLLINNIMQKQVIQKPNILYKDKFEKLYNIIDKLELVNPLKILKRGYSLVYKEDVLIQSIKDVTENDNLSLLLNDGNIDVKVIKIRGE